MSSNVVKRWDSSKKCGFSPKYAVSPSFKITLLRVIPTLTLICHCFWHIIWIYGIFFWHSILAFYLAIYLSDFIFWRSIWQQSIQHLFWHSFLAFYLVYNRRFFVVEVRRETLRSWARGGGPAGNTLILSLLWRSGAERSVSEFAVRVRWGTLRSSACSWSPAGNTLILSSPFGSGGEHCDLALAVGVRKGSFCSWACCLGPVGNTAI